MGERRECDECRDQASKLYVLVMVIASQVGMIAYQAWTDTRPEDFDRRLTALEAAQKK